MPLYFISVKSEGQWEEVARIVASDIADVYGKLRDHLRSEDVGKPISFKRAERGRDGGSECGDTPRELR
jgi:hypothetical protein